MAKRQENGITILSGLNNYKLQQASEDKEEGW